MGIFEDFNRGTGIFSPFALSSEKRLAQAAAPALAHSLGSMNTQAMRGQTDTINQHLQGKYGTQQAGIRDTGETLRTNIIQDAQKIITEMQQSGQNWREQYRQNATTGRNESSLSSDRWKDIKRRRHELDILDQEFNLNQSVLGQDQGAVDPGAVLDMVERQGFTSAGNALAAPAGGRGLRYNETMNDYNIYDNLTSHEDELSDNTNIWR